MITDDEMRRMLGTSRTYTLVLLHATPKRREPGVEPVIWEHGRRNFMLRAEGALSIVCPVAGNGMLSGIGIFNRSEEEVRRIMEEDPGVRAGVFTYEVHTCRSFPGDNLPA